MRRCPISYERIGLGQQDGLCGGAAEGSPRGFAYHSRTIGTPPSGQRQAKGHQKPIFVEVFGCGGWIRDARNHNLTTEVELSEYREKERIRDARVERQHVPNESEVLGRKEYRGGDVKVQAVD